MTTYAPGTVAKVTDADGTVRTMMLVPGCWHGVRDNGDLRCLDATQAEDVRPLVVIDPDDHEQVAELVGGWVDKGAHLEVGVPRMQIALRSLVADPKPEEPTGLGAVVEDSEGALWVRADADDAYPWRNTGGDWTDYPDIAAVRVLSAGVTA